MERRLMRRRAVRFLALSATLAGLCGCGGDEPPDFGPPQVRGTVTITWRLLDASGEETSCAAVGAMDTYVALGGEPRVVTCGDEQRVQFTNLTPQRYPVVLRLRGLGEATIPQGEVFDNVIVEGADEIVLPLEIQFDEDSGSTGRTRFAWAINNQIAATGCEEVGAVTVHGESTAGAVAPFSFDVPCTDGEHIESNMRPGAYEAVIVLQDSAGETISARMTSFRVSRQSTAEAVVSFSSGVRPRSSMFVQWTVSSSAAAEACRDDWSIRLLIQEDQLTPIQTASATAACDRGEYFFDDLPSPNNPAADRYKLTVTLVEELRGDLDRILVDDLQLLTTETTSVSVDLIPPE